MKAQPAFDPDAHEFGVPTRAIRTIVREHVDTDWFAPTHASDLEVRRHFDEHQALAHAAAPPSFAARVDVRIVSGGWPDFIEWCNRVRSQTAWDWRWEGLKRLSSEHAKACSWTIHDYGRGLPDPMTHPFLLAFANASGRMIVVWKGFVATYPVDVTPGPTHDSAHFYFSYAHQDAMHAVEWQLAEDSDDMTRNPFVPLLRCYRVGGYPFSLDRDTVVLFRFAGDEITLPKASLLKHG